MLNVKEIQVLFEQTKPEELPEILMVYKKDSRSSVLKLIQRYENKIKKIKEEEQRLLQMKEYEHKYKAYTYICGIDEVGRGPLAGPVVAGAVILPKACKILYINDSKKLSESKRESLYDEIMAKATGVGIGIVSPGEIDEINILQATYKAMRIAVGKLPIKPEVLLNDAVTIPGLSGDFIQVPIIKGDGKSVSIAAASIVAKVTRDRMMKQYHTLYPAYNFESNKGYGSKEHIQAIQEMGPCPIHRNSFIKNFI